MRTVKTPDNREVTVADIRIRYLNEKETIDVTVVIDDLLALDYPVYLDDPEWEAWDSEFFYYFTEEEWEAQTNGTTINHEDGINVSDEWEIIKD